MVNLIKQMRTYFVIADDECIGVSGCHRPGFERFRNILLVEAAPIDPDEYEARHDWHDEGVRDSQSPLSFLIYEAVSSKHAVRQARRQYEADRAEEVAMMRHNARSR
ncbi:hypothetical protein [Streptomyces sp. NPDC051577]|uniref:hypothetical protein n=1 Tax=Streptomyces sp. NPDC051577 TaxID=3155166 RepID=UPI003420FC95